jgi:RimJ/RimL family protein N-acetyltransferase
MQITTARLTLRDFREDDWQAMSAYWSDPRYQQFYPVHADSDGMVRELVGRFTAAQALDPRRSWQLAILNPEDGRLIGNCGVRINDPELREASIGFELNPDCWGHGYATEAARAVVAVGFDEVGLHRIWAECVADNRASAHVLEKLGMRREAHFREHQQFRGRWWDTLIYAVLDHEWQAQQLG